MIVKLLYCLVVAFAVSCSPVSSLTSNAEQAIVLSVIDGDTLEVSLNGGIERVRLIGVDTPEVTGQVGCYGPEASQFVKGVAHSGYQVILEKDVSATDRAGRLLRYVYLYDGRMLNEALLEEGYAVAVELPPDTRYSGRFRTAEESAIDAALGLWGACTNDGGTSAAG